MDLVALGCDSAPDLNEGDWLELDYDLPSAAAAFGAVPRHVVPGMEGREG